jgi:hypothetical protein
LPDNSGACGQRNYRGYNGRPARITPTPDPSWEIRRRMVRMTVSLEMVVDERVSANGYMVAPKLDRRLH